MRKLATALALVLVSFAVGALFSGNGRPWDAARAQLRSWLAEPKGPQILDKTLLAGESPQGIPAAPIPSLRFESERPESTALLKDDDPTPSPAPSPVPDPKVPDPDAEKVAADGPAPGSEPAPAKPEGGAIKLAGFPEPLSDPKPSPGPDADAPPSDPEVSPAGLEAAEAPEASWKRLRQSMTELGISRYWIEGEPNGPVKFRCVVPLVDEKVVGQQFEAEGEDVIEAAEAALRRVGLWRASEQP